MSLSLSTDSRTTAGILLITVLAVEYGGVSVLRKYLGAAALAAGALSLGIGLLTA